MPAAPEQGMVTALETARPQHQPHKTGHYSKALQDLVQHLLPDKKSEIGVFQITAEYPISKFYK